MDTRSLTRTPKLLPLRAPAMAFGLAIAFHSAPVIGQVYQLDADGTVYVRSGTGAATWQAPDADGEGQDAVPQAAMSSDLGSRNKLLSSIPARFSGALHRAAAAADISPSLLAALVGRESSWNPTVTSPKGAIGLAQLMPATARELGLDPTDPEQNLLGGARYLRNMLNQFDGDLEKALAAYNAGPRRVRNAGGVPKIAETRAYVSNIINRLTYADGVLK